jgi:hypothetical protein
MSTIIRWEDPPPVTPLTSGFTPIGSPNYGYDRIVRELMTKPGQWALIKSIGWDTGKAQSMRTALQRRGAEVTQRTVDHTIDVYARWPECDF